MSLYAVVDRPHWVWLTKETRRYILMASVVFTAGPLTPVAAVAAIQIDAPVKAKAPQPPASAASAAKKATLPISAGPSWQELTPAQKDALKPLATNWNHFPEAKKRKWIVIAANYATLPPDGQAKLHSRMSDWVSLSPEQRNQARLNFAELKQLSPDQKAATWEAYQALSPEEKKNLALAAPQKPVGAAPAVKPVPPQKLALIPVTKQTRPPLPPASAASAASAPKVPLLVPAPALLPASSAKN